ncbi:MAG: dTMP kinase [Fimbriimonas sp.]
MIIVFEGLDRTGKTTQAELLKSRLELAGREVLVSGMFGTPYGRRVRELFMAEAAEAPVEAQLHLIASAASELKSHVAPVVDRGGTVILDRYVYTTYAYHGFGLGVNLETVQRILESSGPLLAPDRIFLLDANPMAVKARRDADSDRIEKMSPEFQALVRDGYQRLASGDPRWSLIDAALDEARVHEIVITELSRRKPQE